MSEVLRDFVAPYWHIPDTEEAVRKLLTTALVAWNTALMPSAEQAGALDQVTTALPEEARKDFYAIVREMIERKNKHFAEYDRLILDYELVDRGNDFHITVALRGTQPACALKKPDPQADESRHHHHGT